MKGLLVHIPCLNCSYRVLLNIMQKYTDYTLIPVLKSPGSLNLTETIYFYNAFSHNTNLTGIIWSDTKFNAKNLKNIKSDIFKHAKVYTTSKWNAELLKQTGNHVDGIIPRFIDIDTAKQFNNTKKVYDFILIANTDKTIDHKHVALSHQLLKRLGVRERSLIISNTEHADIPVFSLSEAEKYQLLAQSYFYLALSGSEGFGLPPVEAMAVGTIPIYLNAHAFAEWLHGIPINYEKVETKIVDNLYMDIYEPDINDTIEKMKYALSIRNTKEYTQMQEEVKKYALETFDPRRILKEL